VSLVQSKKDKSVVYALKVMRKSVIVKYQQESSVMGEKQILSMCDYPFILRLHTTFKDQSRLYMLLEYCPGGELHSVIHTPTSDGISLEAARFYCAGILLALKYMSERNIMHRDLKPRNVVVCGDGYLKVVDFGLAKTVVGQTRTICGTPNYMSPEVYRGLYGLSADLWAWAITLYECIAGRTPFGSGATIADIEKNVLIGKWTFPRGKFDPASKELMKSLLSRDPQKRKGIEEIMQDPFFDGFDFDQYTSRTMPAPWVPQMMSLTDTSNFNPVHCGDATTTQDRNYRDITDWAKDF
jgi:serine/threonine protein kinase